MYQKCQNEDQSFHLSQSNRFVTCNKSWLDSSSGWNLSWDWFRFSRRDDDTEGWISSRGFLLLWRFAPRSTGRRKQLILRRRQQQGCSNKVLYKHSYTLLLLSPHRRRRRLNRKFVKQSVFFLMMNDWPVFERRFVESTEKVLRVQYITTFLLLSCQS